MAIKISQGLKLKQSQKMSMTPQLQQAIKLLTLTHLEMTAHIAEELVENPVIEEMGGEELLTVPEKTQEAPDDFDWQSYVEVYSSQNETIKTYDQSEKSEEAPNYENVVSQEMTLAEHLQWQLRMEDLSEIEWAVADMIIHNLNDDGYLSSSFEELIAEIGEKRELCFEIRDKISQLDPVGCACETLSECLLVQAKLDEERSPLLEKIIISHLPDLQNRNYAKIAKATGASEEMVIRVSDLLHNYHPKPGRLVASQYTHYIIPDVYVVQVGGEFVVQVNDEGVPRLRISKYYKQLLNQAEAQDETQKYIQEKLKSAVWLLKSIQNRQKTIYRVAKSIVAHQQKFFKKGPKFLRPLILKDIANEIGVHESTVSRVTSNKYMHTPIGMFELKYFFNSGVGGKDGGEDVSSEAVKYKIKEMIGSENPQKPLSDQKIVELLAREDLIVARRTVAKYREMLGIFSSSKRKKNK